MLDLIASFSTRVLQLIGRGIGFAITIILRPFVWAGHWYRRRGWTLKIVLGAMLLTIIGLYGYFFWNTQRWANFNPDYGADSVNSMAALLMNSLRTISLRKFGVAPLDPLLR